MEEKCCPYCGKPLQENAIFCPFCMQQLTSKQCITPKQYSKKKCFVLSGILVFLALIVGVALYFLTRPCDHQWESDEEIIHHDAVGYMDLIITGYETRQVYYCYYEPEQYIACFSMEGMRRHMEENHKEKADYAWVMENLDALTKIQEENLPVYDYAPYDIPAYDETVIVGYRCGKCGEIKELENPGAA